MSSSVHTTGFLRQPIERFVDQGEAADGVDVRGLRSGDTLLVRTCHSLYRLALTDPERGHALVSGNSEFLGEQSVARVVGSSLSGRGTLVKSGWILVGFKLLLAVEGGELLTSRVRDVLVNGRSLIPATGVH